MRTVYIHTTPDGKKYVGATHQNPIKRFNNGHGYRYQFFYQAVLKFGWENISHQLYEVDTEEELKYLERYLISYYDTTNPEKGYNIAKGDSTQDHGYDHPEFGKSDKNPRDKEIQHKYSTSEKGREHHRLGNKKYHHTEKGKSSRKKYDTSEKGKETYKRAYQRYNHTNKRKEAQKKYRTSEKGKLVQQLAVKRYLEKKKKQMKNE